MRARSFRASLLLMASLGAAACTNRCAPGQDAATLLADATAAMHEGRLHDARTIAERAIALSGPDRESADNWRARLLHCEIQLNALASCQPESIFTAPLPDDPSFAGLRQRQQYLLAKRHVADGRLEDALALLDSVAANAATPDQTKADAEILGGQVRLRLGRFEEAERQLTAVVDRSGTNRHRQALALNNLGMGRLIRSRYDEAVSLFERVLAMDDLQRFAVYGGALSNAGICYSRLGDFTRALDVQRRAVELSGRRGPTRQYVETLGSLGVTYGLMGQPAEAIPFFERALETSRHLEADSDAALWAGNLSTAYASLARWDEAERFNAQARRLSIGSRTLRPVHFTLNDAEIAAGRGRTDEAVRLFENALNESGGIPAIEWNAHAGLGRAAVARGDLPRASRHFEAALDTIERTRSNLLRTEFKLSFLSQLIEFYRSYVDVLVDQQQFERALEVVESSRARVLAERHGVSPSPRAGAHGVRAFAKSSNAVLLSYWLSPRRSSLWIVTGDGVRHVALPPADAINDLVEQHQSTIHNAIADPLGTPGTAGDKLYSMLVEPAESALRGSTAVIVVPDGSLHRLNFETLPVPGDRRHYLIEDVEIQVAPALTMLTRSQAADAPGQLLIIGDAEGRKDFPALRYASVEMANIARHYSPSRVATFARADAVPGAYLRAEPRRYAMVHFTAHALANPESPLDSAIMLSGPDHAYKLYARAVADLPLSADLVTISACRSAGDRTYSGEGLVGFAWAFMRAGARRVVAGLWDVDDRSTEELMSAMYARLSRGEPPARALRAAKLEMLASGGPGAKPFYWAPFLLFTTSN